MHVSFDENVYSTDAIELYFLVLVLAPITHAGHVFSPCVILLVPLGQDDVFVQRFCQTPALICLYP